MPMRRALFAAALALLAACTSATTPGSADVRVRTDQAVYALPAGGAQPVMVPFTVQNTTDDPVHVAACGTAATAVLDHREGGRWATVNSGFCVANLDVGPVTLAPGETLAGVVSVGRVSGTYRIRVPLGEAATDIEFAVSPSFEVRWTDG
jgi:hypothetical protein